MAPWKSSKFLDALTSQSIGRDASDAGQSVGCSMVFVTRNDFDDCVHEMNFLTKRQNQKSRRKTKRTSKRRSWRKESEKRKKGGKKNLFWGEPYPQLHVDLDFRHSRYINRASDRLALCPRWSNQNPAQLPYFDFAFLRLWLTMISSRKDACERALFFVSSPTASGVQLPFETNSIWIFFRQAFCPSLPVFYAHEIDEWRPKFRFRLWWSLIDWLLSVVFGEGARKHRENNQCEESNPQSRNGRVRTLGITTISSSLDRALPSLRHRALLGKWPEIGDISSKRHDFVSIDENGACCPRLAPQSLHSLV